jgi:hypothetical protein
MSFFDPPPDPPDRPRPVREPWRGDADDTVGGLVDFVAVLAKNEDAAVLVAGLTGYPAGFAVSLISITRKNHPYPPMFRHDSSEQLRFGMRFADGSKVTDSRSGPPPFGPRAGERMLHQRGGGGGGRRHAMSYWCAPLPPPGPLTFVCQWPHFGIELTEFEVEAGLILDAADRSFPLWPDDIGMPNPYGRPVPGPVGGDVP